jgi:uncharacterized membrane protein YcaP (DUF421 family)
MSHALLAGSVGDSLFHLRLPVEEKIFRSLLVFFFLVIALRLGGKRELAQLNVLDFAVLLLASNALQNAMIGEDNSVTGGIVGASALFFANYWFVRLNYRNARLRRIFEGKPRILLSDGKPDREALKREAITEAELLDTALDKGFASLSDVGLVVIEPNGHMAVLDKKMGTAWLRGEALS